MPAPKKPVADPAHKPKKTPAAVEKVRTAAAERDAERFEARRGTDLL